MNSNSNKNDLTSLINFKFNMSEGLEEMFSMLTPVKPTKFETAAKSSI